MVQILIIADPVHTPHIFAVCKSLKTHVDHPIFWIQKFDKRGESKELHDAWIDLIHRIKKLHNIAQLIRSMKDEIYFEPNTEYSCLLSKILSPNINCILVAI